MAIVLGTSSGFVIVAPTADPAGSDTTIDGSSVVTKHTAPAGETITITEIGWYRGSGTNTANFEVALYSESAGVAATRLQVDNTNSSAAGGWITTAVSWTITAGTAYWLAVQMDAHSGSSTIDSTTSGGVGSDVLTSQTTLADPYGGGAVGQAAGMYAIYAKLSIVRNISAGVGALTLSGFAPTVFASNNKNISADVGALTIAGFAPTVVLPVNINPSLGTLTLAGFAPGVEVPRNIPALTGDLTLIGFAPVVQIGVNINTSLGDINLSGFSPTVVASDNKIVTPDIGALTVSGFAPIVSTPVNIPTSTGVITVTGFEPTVIASDHKNILADVGPITVTGFAPSVNTSSGITADTGVLVVTGFAPTLNITAGASPQAGELNVNGFSPTVNTPRNILPGLGDLIINGFAPIINIGGGEALVQTETGLLFITGYSPNVEGGNFQIIPIGSGVDDGGGSSPIGSANLNSIIGRVRKKSKIEHDI